jgi:Flp pilus assembly protein TadD
MKRVGGALALVALAFVAHAPALTGGWIIDDGEYVTENPMLADVAGLARIWLEPGASPQYYPLVFSSFWLERALFGLDPRAFHATNLFLHAAVAVLAACLLRRLEVPFAWLGAALFAVHPLHVDTVAWISERKNLLSALFALLSALLWLEWTVRRSASRPRARAWYAGALSAFVLALLAKTAVVGLPVALALIALWRARGGSARRELASIAPFLVVGSVLATVTVALERELVEGGDEIPRPALAERPLLAARTSWFYLGKLVLPTDLAFDHGHWPTAATEPLNLVATLALALAAIALWRLRRRWGLGPLVAAGSFLALAAPSLGLVSFYFQRYSYVAGHFAYLPSVPILALLAAAGGTIVGRRVPRAAGAVAAGLVLAGLGATTWRHAHDYRDHEALARATLRVNPESWLAHNHLGNEAIRRGEFTVALEHLESAERAAPGRIETQLNLAIARMNAGDLAGAEVSLQRARGVRDTALGRLLLGDLRLRAGRAEEAAAAYRAAAEAEPSVRARRGLGIALAQAGRHAEAIAVLEPVVGDEPDNVPARTALAFSLAATGRRVEALAEIDRALMLEPGNPVLQRNRALLQATGPP